MSSSFTFDVNDMISIIMIIIMMVSIMNTEQDDEEDDHIKNGLGFQTLSAALSSSLTLLSRSYDDQMMVIL